MEVSETCIVDLDGKGNLVGVETLSSGLIEKEPESPQRSPGLQALYDRYIKTPEQEARVKEVIKSLEKLREVEAVVSQCPVEISRERRWYVASCSALDVHSQGKTEKKARANLEEAVEGFLHSCLDRGTLDAVLYDMAVRAYKIDMKYALWYGEG